MNGVEILSQETIYNTILPEWCLTVGLVFGVVCIVIATRCFVDGYDIIAAIFLIIVVACVVVACLSGTHSKTDISHIEYKVTIDDSVSMNDFIDKYEILDQEGKIYTVKEREN